jgi:predicted DsbA family dithiol-disulfide isomerase
MKIDFVSDVACPWCAVGLNALEQALAAVERDGIHADVLFQPFELNPQMPVEGEDADQHLARKYRSTPEQRTAARANLRQRGAEVGFTFGTRSRVWNTFDAHRLLHWAALQGDGGKAQRALKHALLKAYHADGRNPGARDVLIELAGAIGLDATRAAAIIDSDEYSAEVRAAEAHWHQLGISSVPSVVINGRHLIQGGQPAETFERVLRELAAEEKAAAA